MATFGNQPTGQRQNALDLAAARGNSEPASTASGNAGTEGEIYQNVNEETDTVLGQLEKHTDFSSPVMQRVAQQARDRVAARGLTNSSIAIGNATGAVVDHAGKFATEDARIYNERKTENQRAETHIRDSNIRANATVQAAGISAGATVAAARIGADANIRITEMNNENRRELQEMETASRERLQRQSDRSQLQRLLVDTRSRHSIAKMEIQATQENAELDRASRERQTQISADNQWQISQFQQASANDRQKAEMYDNIWRDYNTAVMNIDINASAASQREQMTRINDAARIRLESGGYIDAAVNGTPASVTPPAVSPAVQPGQSVLAGTSFRGSGIWSQMEDARAQQGG